MAKKKKKKNKKNIAKRQAKAGQRKAQKKKLRLVKAKQKKQHPRSDYDHMSPDFDYLPLAPDTEAPAGFRAVDMTQALMEFAKDMVKHPDIKGLDSMEDAMNLAMPIWNYTIAMEQGEENQKLKSEIIKALMPVCKVDRKEAGVLADKMVARKNEMFPPDIQPHGTMEMFMRKEFSYVITPFNYGRLKLSDKQLPAVGDDLQFLDMLAALDETKQDSEDCDEWHEQYDAVEEKCGEVFNAWLEGKGVDPDFISNFGFRATFFTNFVYNYGYEDTDILRNIDDLLFDDFFYDFVLRKIMMEPDEHVDWVPALRLFFLFLAEKGYLDDATRYVDTIDTFEVPFLQFLRKEYS